MKPVLYCGAAKEKITPPEAWLTNLRGLMDSRFGGILDELYVRVIALQSGEQKMLLISMELDKVPNPTENLKRLEQETGIPQEFILLAAIHTHSAPVAGDRPYEGPNYIARKPEAVQRTTADYEELIREQLVLAAKKAMAGMVEVKAGIAYGSSYINVNRVKEYQVFQKKGSTSVLLGTGTDFSKPADRTLFTMKFEDMQGKAVAYFINYPVHNTVMILNGCGKDRKAAVSSDLAGKVCADLEAQEDGGIALWTSGAAGDLNPIFSNQVYREDPVTGIPQEIYEKNAYHAVSMRDTLAAHHLSDVKQTLAKSRWLSGDLRLEAGARWLEMPGKDEEGRTLPFRIRLHCMKIGKIELFGVNGELYSGLAGRLKKSCSCENMIWINHDASLLYNTGYIYGDEIFDLAKRYPGEIVGMNHTWQTPGTVEPALQNCIEELRRECR